MTELPNPIGQLLTDEVDEARIHRIVTGAVPVSRSSTRRRVVWGAAALVAGVFLFWATAKPDPDPGPVRLATPTLLPILAAPADRPLHLALGDGSNLDLESDAILRVVTNERNLVELELVRGRVHFDVRHRTSRRWAIRAGADRIEVVGTRFEVSHERGRVDVRVTEGIVRVVGPNRDRTLLAGQSYRTDVKRAAPPTPVEAPVEIVPDPVEEPKPPRPTVDARPTLRTSPEPTDEPDPTEPPEATEPPEPPELPEPPEPKDTSPTEDWRTLANRGAYEPAYAALTKRGLAHVERWGDAETLFLAADVARGANDTEVAIDLLRTLLTRFPHSSSAGLASTTRARLLLEEMNDPEGSAAAYRAALDLDLSPDLLETAMVGRVRALARVGHREETMRAAEDYRRRFPNGRWQKIIEQWAR